MATAPKNLGFIHLVPFDRDNPRQGFNDAIELLKFAEELGLDSGWFRTRHMQYGLPSPAVLYGALSQVTEHIELGSAVIPLEFETPYRLAEDLGTADVLTGGRINTGLSVHPPGYGDEISDRVFDQGWREQDYSYERIEELRRLLAGDAVREKPAYDGIGGDIDSERVEPHSPGITDRLWYGGGSARSAEWTGTAGLNWLVSNISTNSSGELRDFGENQAEQIETFRSAWDAAGHGRVSRAAVARVIVPTDGATPEQVAKYRAYAEARTPRTEQVHRGNTIIAKDVLGSTDEIVEFITNDPAFQAADDYIFELPFEMELADWKQQLEQLATKIGPALGWTSNYAH